MAVQVIRATKPSPQTANSAASARLKVAAYCRVSTELEEQESSYEAQCAHYTAFISNKPEWDFAGLYADEGISGTQAKKRPEFLRMIQDCQAGKIDMVITKSISRFSRNTLDCLQYIRLLKEKGIAVFFEKENINTLDAKGEVLITIMASIAQQESQSISQNVAMGIRYKMQEGKGRVNTAFFLGFQKDKAADKLVIVPEEAEIVRRIFREYLEGYSKQMICDRLMADGIKSPEGRDTWFASTVGSMLENEKYAGDQLMQKTYVADFLTHKKVKNNGKLPQYYVEDDHDPIVPRPVYFQVQGELMRRSALKDQPGRIRYGAREALFGRLICGKCGRVLKRYKKPDPEDTDWRCRKRAYTKRSNTKECAAACDCRNVPESDAKRAILEAFNRMPEYRDELIRRQGQLQNGELKRIDALAERSRQAEKRMEKRRLQLEAEKPEAAAGEIAFLEQQIAEEREGREARILERAACADREMRIRLLLELVEAMKNARERCDMPARDTCKAITNASAACKDYEEFFLRTRYRLPDDLLDTEGRLTRFDDDIVTRYLDKVTVKDDGYDIRLKAGFTIAVS